MKNVWKIQKIKLSLMLNHLNSKKIEIKIKTLNTLLSTRGKPMEPVKSTNNFPVQEFLIKNPRKN